MIQKKELKLTDRAWDNLYGRLERDGLLAANRRASRPTASLAWRRVAVAAVLAVAVVLAWRAMQQPAATDMLVLHNETNGSTLVTMLEDGSVVYLAGETSIHYPNHFDDGKREISLQGDAFFDINRRRDCPFFIDAEPVRVEVLGTAFGIRNSGRSAFSLSVERGEVRVTLKKNSQTVHVKAGNRVWLQSGSLQMAAIDTTASGNRMQHVHFKDERLADVVHIINMNARPVQLEVAPELADRRLTVAFADDDPETMAHLICLALDLQHTQRDRTILISGKDD
jgi:ferric-dicitrate binding protein FerR (iron transport regulator)